MNQLALTLRYDDRTISDEDKEDLGEQCAAVLAVLQDRKPRTLKQIRVAMKKLNPPVHAETPSISARIRQLRNECGCTIPKKLVGKRLWAYWLEK